MTSLLRLHSLFDDGTEAEIVVVVVVVVVDSVVAVMEVMVADAAVIAEEFGEEQDQSWCFRSAARLLNSLKHCLH